MAKGLKKALLVGINDYKDFSNNLFGCLNDVRLMHDLLTNHFDFAMHDIRILVDKRATKNEIMSRLAWLVEGAEAGDRLVFFYSGHGSQIRDRSGDELKDHMDEILCPHDFDWEENFISDDDLYNIFYDSPEGVLIEVLLDSCHSGTGLSFVPSLGMAKYIQPPMDIMYRSKGIRLNTRQIRGTPNTILWAGCRSNQNSIDAYIENAYNGAFTYYFCKSVTGKMKRDRIHKTLSGLLKNNGYTQEPQLECSDTARKGGLFE